MRKKISLPVDLDVHVRDMIIDRAFGLRQVFTVVAGIPNVSSFLL